MSDSLAAIAQRDTDRPRPFSAAFKAISTTGFSDQDQLSHDLLMRVLQQRIADFDLKEYEMPVNQQNGIHTGLADLPLSVPLDSVKHYEDYIARLHQIPRVLQPDHGSPARRHEGQTYARAIPASRSFPCQCQGIIAADPFLLPTKKYPASIPPEDQKRLTQQITDASQRRRHSRLQELRGFPAHGICSARPHHAGHHVSARRPEALSKTTSTRAPPPT